MADYIPTREADLVVWFSDHAAGVATPGATVGLSAAEITQVADDASTVAHAVNGRSLYESKKQEFTAYKEILLYAELNTPLPGTPAAPSVGILPLGALSACVARARRRANQIKADAAYTTAIGEDCRIVAPEGGEGEQTPKPALKATVETDYTVRLTFVMRAHDQLEIQSQRVSETLWTVIGFDTGSPYVDGRALGCGPARNAALQSALHRRRPAGRAVERHRRGDGSVVARGTAAPGCVTRMVSGE